MVEGLLCVSSLWNWICSWTWVLVNSLVQEEFPVEIKAVALYRSRIPGLAKEYGTQAFKRAL
jgi:hypothetical protein